MGMHLKMKVLLLLVVLGLIIRTGVSASVSVSASIDNDGVFEEGTMAFPSTMLTSMDDDDDLQFIISLESSKRIFRRTGNLEAVREMDEAIQSEIQHEKTMLGYYEKDAEVQASKIRSLERKMEVLGDEEAGLQSQLDDLKREGTIKKLDKAYGTDNVKLFSTRVALSSVNTQILELMEEKLELQESLTKVKQDILKYQYRLQIVSNPVSLTAAVEHFKEKIRSNSDYDSHSHHDRQVDEDSEDRTERKHADLKETQQNKTTTYNYTDVLSIAVLIGVLVLPMVAIAVFN